jgi:hypothetical protein
MSLVDSKENERSRMLSPLMMLSDIMQKDQEASSSLFNFANVVTGGERGSDDDDEGDSSPTDASSASMNSEERAFVHRLAVLQPNEPPSPRINKRKQGCPHRAIRQLATLAEKIVNGIIIVEPGSDDGRTTIGFLTTHHYQQQQQHQQTAKIVITRDNGVASSPRKKAKTSSSSASSRNRRREESHVLRSPISEASRSPSPHREGSSTNSNDPALNPNSKPTVQIGQHIPEDLDPVGIAARTDAYLAIYKRRKTPGAMALLGSNRLSGIGGTPLDITRSPGASLLDDTEFELCSLLRLQPLQYFQSRDTLLKNYGEKGFYRKSAAQKMLHIDVNKTGRLYDFFVRMNWMPETEDPAAGASLDEPHPVDWERLLP